MTPVGRPLLSIQIAVGLGRQIICGVLTMRVYFVVRVSCSICWFRYCTN